MTLAPRDYISERRREINQRIQVLRSELDALDRMESALSDGPLMSPPAPAHSVGPAKAAPQAPTADGSAKKRRVIEGGIKTLILEALAKYGDDGLASQPLIHAIYQNSSLVVARTSLSRLGAHP